MEFELEDVLFWAIGLVIVALFAFIVWAWVVQYRAEKMELVKSDWSCTQESTKVILVPMVVGKVTVMRPQPMTQCDNWERIK